MKIRWIIVYNKKPKTTRAHGLKLKLKTNRKLTKPINKKKTDTNICQEKK